MSSLQGGCVGVLSGKMALNVIDKAELLTQYSGRVCLTWAMRSPVAVDLAKHLLKAPTIQQRYRRSLENTVSLFHVGQSRQEHH